MRAPRRQAIDARLHGMAEEMPADQRRQFRDLLGRFLQQHQIGLVACDQLAHILGPAPTRRSKFQLDHATVRHGHVRHRHGWKFQKSARGVRSTGEIRRKRRFQGKLRIVAQYSPRKRARACHVSHLASRFFAPGHGIWVTAYVLLAGIVTTDVLLKKSDVRGALGWIGAVWFAPIIGSLLYYMFGINRVTRRALKLARLDNRETAARDARSRARRSPPTSGPWPRSASASPRAR